ncbi:MAG: signal transduction histidine kinase [Flavobacteriales bacterium]|jgi:signal transduction histidine kinase
MNNSKRSSSRSKFSFFHKVSIKLILIFVPAAMALIFFIAQGFSKVVIYHFKENIGPHATQYFDYIKQDIGTPPSQTRAQELSETLAVEIIILSKGEAWSTLKTTDLDWFVAQYSTSKGTPFHGPVPEGYQAVRIGSREYIFYDVDGANVFFSLNEEEKSDAEKPETFFLVIITTLLILLYLSIRLIFRPLKPITNGVVLFGQGDLKHRIKIKRKDEFGELAGNINQMADDIEGMLEAKRQLLLAISHELRSPITRAKLATDLLDNTPLKAGINADLDEMESLINDLLESERLSEKHLVLNKQDTDLNILLDTLISTKFADAKIVASHPEEHLILNLDATRITLLLKNLIQNALSYTADNTVIEVRVASHKSHLTLDITDFGSGIDAIHIPFLTEPFYRVDRSRQRNTDGYGLGLYLCKMIAQAHNGSLKITSELNKGTTVTVCIPMEDVSE